ncbi:hypothetical protein AwMethylo_24800 [Methylobacterium sp.]|nr:hypothetical protein AwMethylo_24800 [Methylobacterium sp.]
MGRCAGNRATKRHARRDAQERRTGMTAAGKGDAARAERLKAALRENLRRRKAQGRARAETGAPPQAETERDG